MNYGYFIPVYQNGSTDEIIGMIFVGTDKQEKDAVINKILGTISMAVCAVMILCIAIGMKLATSMSRNIRSSIEVVGKVADGDLNVWVEDKLLGRHDEIGDLSRVTITLRDAMKATIQEISQNAKRLLDASELLGTAADQTNGTMDHVRMAVNQIVENSTEQAQNSQNTSEHMRIMGENITETSAEVELLDDNAASMQQSSEKAAETLNNLRNINIEVERIIGEVQEQTNRTNDSVQKIHEATAFITSIAEETNLLSLNASIEAARAGESGRGFGVVADQDQEASEQSNESSKEIGGDREDNSSEDSAKAVEIMQQMQGDHYEPEREHAGYAEGSGRGNRADRQLHAEYPSDQRKHCGHLENSRNEVLQAVSELPQKSCRAMWTARRRHTDEDGRGSGYFQSRCMSVQSSSARSQMSWSAVLITLRCSKTRGCPLMGSPFDLISNIIKRRSYPSISDGMHLEIRIKMRHFYPVGFASVMIHVFPSFEHSTACVRNLQTILGFS